MIAVKKLRKQIQVGVFLLVSAGGEMETHILV